MPATPPRTFRRQGLPFMTTEDLPTARVFTDLGVVGTSLEPISLRDPPTVTPLTFHHAVLKQMRLKAREVVYDIVPDHDQVVR